MQINIESAKGDGPRKVEVIPNEGKPFTFTADTLDDAHAMLRKGLEDGWDSIRPAKK